MMIIGCDYHPSFQQVAWLDSKSGECGERKLTHPVEADSSWRPPRSKRRAAAGRILIPIEGF
jgi:hypothetical protein